MSLLHVDLKIRESFDDPDLNCDIIAVSGEVEPAVLAATLRATADLIERQHS